MQFAQIFIKLLEDKKITPYRMSKCTGIPDRMIGRWKNGEIYPSAENLVKIADYFDVSVDYLLGRTNKTEVNK